MKNHLVKKAVKMLGGPSRASRILHVSPATLYDWYRSGRVKSFDKAQMIAAMTGFDFFELRGEQDYPSDIKKLGLPF